MKEVVHFEAHTCTKALLGVNKGIDKEKNYRASFYISPENPSDFHQYKMTSLQALPQPIDIHSFLHKYLHSAFAFEFKVTKNTEEITVLMKLIF